MVAGLTESRNINVKTVVCPASASKEGSVCNVETCVTATPIDHYLTEGEQLPYALKLRKIKGVGVQRLYVV